MTENTRPVVTGGLLARSYLPLLVAVACLGVAIAVVPSRPAAGPAALSPAASGPAAAGQNVNPGAAGATTVPGAAPGVTVASGDSAAPGGSPAAGTEVAGPAVDPASGAQRIGDCPRRQLGFDNCPFDWTGGDNGGATAPGVSADAITVTVYDANPEAQTSGALGADETPSVEEVQQVLDSWARYVNANWQLYGRELRLEYRRGPAGFDDPAQSSADAVSIAEEDHPFAVLVPNGTNALHDELSRRQIISMSALLQFSASYYEERAPYLYSLLPDLDLAMDHVAEYWCRRLEGRPAAHAGAGLQGQPRSLGIIYSPDFNDGGPRLLTKIQNLCGGTVGKVVSYTGGYSEIVSQATNIIGQMRSAGVTSIACICDPVSPIFLTSQATAQGYFPEWIQTGYFAQDSDGVGRLYDQDQWAHSFGVGVIGASVPKPQDRSYLAFTNGAPTVREGAWRSVSFYWTLIEVLAAGIEAAGPALTPASLRDGLFRADTFPPPTSSSAARASFGSNGPSPWTQVDDELEIWWDRSRVSADGEQGAYFLVDGGRRFGLDQWPDTDPNVFVDDGSPQPAPGSSQ